jgi:LuxR family maltose regulon positive regulatory protein
MIPAVRPLLRRHPRERTAHGALIDRLLERLDGPAAERPAEALTDRELTVLRLLTTNLSAAEIAGELLLSVHTVKTHMRAIYAKLGAHRRSEAVRRARSLGVLGGPYRKG